MSIFSEAPGISGKPADKPDGPLWYSPVQINIPDFTETVRTAFDTVRDVIKPLVEIQKVTFDIFQPVLDSINRKADIFASAINGFKDIASSMLEDVISVIHRTGIYALLVVPDFKLNRYVWLPKVVIIDQDNKVVIDDGGGFFSINEAQYNQFLTSKTFKLQTGLGTTVLVEPRAATVFFSIGSTGIAGYLEKFDKSFEHVGNKGGTAAGIQSDLCIPTFQKGDVVAGMSFLVSASGFNNFVDSIFALINLFMPSGSIFKAFKEAFPIPIGPDSLERVLRKIKLDFLFEPGNHKFKTQTPIVPNADRPTLLKALDIPNQNPIQFTFRTAPLSQLPYWRVSFWLKVDQIKSDPGEDPPAFDYGAGADPTDREKSRVELSGWKKMAVIHSPSLVGQNGIPEYDSQVTDLTNNFHIIELLNNGHDARCGIRLKVPESHFDSRYNLQMVLETLYNRAINPFVLVGDVVSQMIVRFPELLTLIPETATQAGKSAVDVLASTINKAPVQSFEELVLLRIPETLLAATSSPGFSTLRYRVENGIAIISPEYLAVIGYSRFIMAKIGRDDDDSYVNAVAQETYLTLKLGNNPRGNFWIDEFFGTDWRAQISKRTDMLQAALDSHKIAADWDVVDVVAKQTTMAIPPPSGRISVLANLIPGKGLIGDQRAAAIGVHVPPFQIDRWFCLSVDAYWPALGEFLGRLKEVVSGFNVSFPDLKSPYLDFVNRIFTELNKILERINLIIETILAVTETLELLIAEDIHVLRLEDELGSGYTTAGIDGIRTMIKTAPGLPEFLKEDGTAAITANIGAGGQVTRGDRPQFFSPTHSITDNDIQVSSKRDDFVAGLTFLVGAPVFEDIYTKHKNQVANVIDSVANIDASKLGELAQLELETEGLALRIGESELRQKSLQAVLDNNLTLPADRAAAEAGLVALTSQIKEMQDRFTAITAQMKTIEGMLNIKIEDFTPDPAATERQASVIKFPFDFFETMIMQTSTEKKKQQAGLISS